MSDHRPITIQLQVSLKTNSTVDEDTNLVASKLKWDQLYSDDIVRNQERLQQLVGAKTSALTIISDATSAVSSGVFPGGHFLNLNLNRHSPPIEACLTAEGRTL